MASIPLPALHVNPPTDQGEGIQRMVQMMTMLRQQKAQDALLPGQVQQQQQAIQATGLENQLRQQAIKNQQAQTAAMQEWDGKDMNTLPGLMLKHGATADVVMSTKSAITKQLQEMENLSKDQLSNQATVNDRLLGHIDAIKGVTDPAQRGSVAQQQAQQIIQAGLHKNLDPQSAQMVQAISQGQMVPTDDQIAIFEKGLTAHNAQIEQAAKAAETREKNAQAGKLELEADPNNPANPDIRKQKYEGILSKVQTGGGFGAVTSDELAFARSYENGQRKTTTQSDSLGVTSTNTSGPSGLDAAARQSGKGSPAQGGGGAPSSGGGGAAGRKNDIVDEIGQYKVDLKTLSRTIAKHPDVINAVAQRYPDWSQSNYNAANKAVTDLAPSGKTGQQITSYNTFLRHAGALYDAVGSLDNSKYGDLVNKPMNWLAQHTGDPRVADFMAAMQPPMKEFQSFLLNNHAMHEEDVKDAHNLIDVNKTPQEIRAVLKRFAETGSARLSEQNESFKRVTGRDIPNLVSPQAAAAYNKITGEGGAGGAIPVKAPNGKTYTFKDQASADAFKAKLPQ